MITTRELFEITPEMFGPLLPHILNERITDIDYNGRDLWLTDIENKRKKIPSGMHDITELFAKQFAQRISNATGKQFNQKYPSLEGETRQLRISIMHESISTSGMSICIRKTPPFARITENYALKSDYMSAKCLNLLKNCIKAHMNIVIAGQPRAGKTEACKFLANYIPDEERVITIEDVQEWRYKELKPMSDALEWKIRDDFDYADAIVAALKQNPKWIMVAETRGVEVKYLIQGFSTGVNGMTTLHAEDVSKIPQRMLNMVDDSMLENRFLSNIYDFVDVGILVSIKTNESGQMYRLIDQVGFFSSEHGNNCDMVLTDGKMLGKYTIPPSIMQRFLRCGINDPFVYGSSKPSIRRCAF